MQQALNEPHGMAVTSDGVSSHGRARICRTPLLHLSVAAIDHVADLPLELSRGEEQGGQKSAGDEAREEKGSDGRCMCMPTKLMKGCPRPGSGDVYIAETWSSCIRLLRRGVLSTIAGVCGQGGHADGEPVAARFQHPHHINLDPRNESHL